MVSLDDLLITLLLSLQGNTHCSSVLHIIFVNNFECLYKLCRGLGLSAVVPTLGPGCYLSRKEVNSSLNIFRHLQQQKTIDVLQK